MVIGRTRSGLDTYANIALLVSKLIWCPEERIIHESYDVRP
jgi:hypothetical protein